ncbi:nucleotidyl transferase AbiEii/AbiGii toxin family protein [Pseudomonas lini]
MKKKIHVDGSLLGIATKRHENHCFAEALKNKQDLAPLRVVVEKELLHHDIMLALSSAGMLAKLTFIGDTCLRACYGSNRLSEDLDFYRWCRFQSREPDRTCPCIGHHTENQIWP